MGGLLAAAHTVLGYVPRPEWCDAAAPLLARVLPALGDPRGREAISAALEAAGGRWPSSVA